MVECRVLKSHAHINDRVYKRSETVELSEKEALYLISQNVVMAASEAKLPSEADGILAEKEKEVEKLKEIIKLLTTENGKLTEELQKTKEQLKEVKVTRK